MVSFSASSQNSHNVWVSILDDVFFVNDNNKHISKEAQKNFVA